MTATDRIVEQLGGFPQVQSAMGDGRTPPSGGSGVTRDIPEGIPIGQRPTAPCRHDFVFLRTTTRGGGADVFYCSHCLEQRDLPRNPNVTE